MVRALRVVTVERGVDPRDYALLPFGGAGPMHAAAIAGELEIDRVLCPRAGGVLSALGLCASERRRDTARTVMLSGEELTSERVAAETGELISSQRAGLEGAEARVAYELRYRGQAFELAMPGPPGPDPAELRERFEAAHEQRYGYRDPGRPSSWSTSALRWSTAVPGRGRWRRTGRPGSEMRPAGALRRRVVGGRRCFAGSLPPGPRPTGPAIFELPEATSSLPAGLARRGRARRDDRRRGPPMSLDPITLQVLIGALRAACEEMGAVLVRAAHSANIKERRDCSTALFDAARRAGDAGGAHPGPPRLDARRGRGGARRSSSGPATSWILNDPYRAAPTCPTSP